MTDQTPQLAEKAQITALARHWYEADQMALYGHVDHWDEDHEEPPAYEGAVARLFPAVRALMAQAWEEGFVHQYQYTSAAAENPYRVSNPPASEGGGES